MHVLGFTTPSYPRKVNATSEVQVITAVAAASDLEGYFFVGYEGHWSEKINHDAHSDKMASALAGIPAVGEVLVSEREYSTIAKVLDVLEKCVPTS